MKIQIESDLHINTYAEKQHIEKTDADLIVVVGDVHYNVAKAVDFLEEQAQSHGKKIIYVLGNHEGEGIGFKGAVDYAKERLAKSQTGIIHLENETHVIEDVQFIGATYWTNFQLFGEREFYFATHHCKKCNDFETIPDLSIGNAVKWHDTSYAYIENVLYNNNNQYRKNVVLTHFTPSAHSVAEQFKKDLLSAYFSNRDEALMGFDGFWIHGHTHFEFDYMLGDTNVICNPRGYETHRRSVPMPEREHKKIKVIVA